MIDDMAVYIANLGKYNEGYLVGAWFTFPIDEEDVKEKIGLNEQYEEYAVHDTDNFPIAIGEYVSIEKLNEMYEMIEELPDYIVECLDEFISHYGSLEEVVEHKDDIYYYPGCCRGSTCPARCGLWHHPMRRDSPHKAARKSARRSATKGSRGPFARRGRRCPRAR